MGQVFLAQSPGGRAVAIKVIQPELAAKGGFRDRFAREVSAARNVSGMFTAAVVDADPDAELPWMATAFVQGPSLADAVEEQGPLAPDAVLSLAAGLAEGLQAIHKAGLVHRDLKPSNVLLAEDGPRIIDFGISWAREERESRLTDAGIVVGSPGFLSPEQATGREVGPASDVFCLGAVLTYAATGDEPFGLGSTQALLYRVVHEPPDLTTVPSQLRPLVSACLAKDPGHRPTTAQLLSRLADSLTLPAAADELAMAEPGTRVSRQSASARPLAGLSPARVPATGDRLVTDLEVPDTRRLSTGIRRGGIETAPDQAPDPGGSPRRPWRHSRPASRRWLWPATAALACVLLAVGVVMALAPSGSRQPAGPTAPAVPYVPTHGGTGASTPSGGARGTRPSSTGTAPANAKTTSPKASATTAPASTQTTPASQSTAPTSTQPPGTQSTAPAQPTTQPSSTGCLLGICIG